MEILLDDYVIECGMIFYKFKLECNYDQYHDFERTTRHQDCLFLPRLDQDGMMGQVKDKYYYCINSEWEELKDGCFETIVAPGLVNDFFS